MSNWTIVATDTWAECGGITSGRVFRSLRKGDGDTLAAGLSTEAIADVVAASVEHLANARLVEPDGPQAPPRWSVSRRLRQPTADLRLITTLELIVEQDGQELGLAQLIARRLRGPRFECVEGTVVP
jgi:hypothetical protein